MQMRHTGYDFSQLGGVFVVHYPHLESKHREVWNQGRALRKTLSQNNNESATEKFDWTKYKRGKVDKIFLEFKIWLREQVREAARVSLCENAFNDDERLWV